MIYIVFEFKIKISLNESYYHIFVKEDWKMLNLNEEPLVTVNILSYNRKDELRNTLTKVFELDHKNIEVIVVDNASSDGAPEMVEREFPNVNLKKLDKNIGIAGWNKGFEAAKGEYILVLDDDSYPDYESIGKALNCFHDESVGIVYMPVYNLHHKQLEGNNIDVNNPQTFIGCGGLIKTEVIRNVGVYSDLLFLYEHEIEFSMRVYNEGFIIKYCPDAIIYHENSLKNRKVINKIDQRKIYFISRNYIIILFLHFSLGNFIFFVPQLIIGRIISSLFQGAFYNTVKGFTISILLLPSLVKKRTVLKKSIRRFYNLGNYMGRFVVEKNY